MQNCVSKSTWLFDSSTKSTLLTMRMKCESRLRHSAVLEPTNCGVTIRLGEFHLCRIYRKVHRRVLLWETIGKSNKRGTRRTTQESGARLCYANCGALTLFVFLWCKKSYRSGMHFSFESFLHLAASSEFLSTKSQWISELSVHHWCSNPRESLASELQKHNLTLASRQKISIKTVNYFQHL